MSKPNRAFPLFFPALLLILQFFNNAAGQEIEILIRLGPNGLPLADVTGKFDPNGAPKSVRNLSFARSEAGVENLASRISEVRALDSGGSNIGLRKLMGGEYLAEKPIAAWSYVVELSPAKPHGATAHVSWVEGDTGVLMLDDLLPHEVTKIQKMDIGVPPGWSALASASIMQMGSPADGSRTMVIPIGKGWRERAITFGNAGIKLRISGEWLFTDEEAEAIAGEIFQHYRELFDSEPSPTSQIVIAKLQGSSGPGSWEAETRGRTIMIISGDMNFRTQSIQRLHEQLRHEMFHLWLPNGVNLKGNYDWFYEGFALYQSLKTGVVLNRIRFDDFLETLSRAYEIDVSIAQKRSLIDASAKRWSDGDTQVYARGMIVAFLCDLALLDKSGGKRGVAEIEREIFQKYKAPAMEADGNEAVLSILREHAELLPLLDKYVTGADPIDWTAQLRLAGIESTGEGRHTNLKVVAKPAGRQKTLLDKLGYNSWRKLAGSSK